MSVISTPTAAAPKVPGNCFSLGNNCIVFRPKDCAMEIRLFSQRGRRLVPMKAGCMLTRDMWWALAAASDRICKALFERRCMEIPCGEWLVACVRPRRGLLGVWLSGERYGNIWLTPEQWYQLCQQARAITMKFNILPPPPPPPPRAISPIPPTPKKVKMEEEDDEEDLTVVVTSDDEDLDL